MFWQIHGCDGDEVGDPGVIVGGRSVCSLLRIGVA